MRARHPYVWAEDHPVAVDALLGVGITVIGWVTAAATWRADGLHEPGAVSVVLVACTALPLAMRRVRPVAVYAVVAFFAFLTFTLGHAGGGPFLALLVAIYTAAAHAGRRTAGVLLAITLAGLFLGMAADSANVETSDVIGTLGMFLAAWVLGDSIGVRRAYVAAIEDRAVQAERSRDALAERAVLEERSRIARDLHDIVAHSMSVMVVQAGAARRTLARDPDRAVEAIGHIESTGRGALAEMRRLVGVLRDTDSDGDGRDPVDGAGRPAPLEPQPGLGELPGLVRQCREAGLEVAFAVTGGERPLPSGVELVLYRIGQEALANAIQHAGPARVDVELRFDRDAVVLTVSDDGRGAAPTGDDDGDGRRGPVPQDTVAGHGLTGMRERVALYGGALVAGPRAGGGFRVRSTLPVPDAAPGDGAPASGPAGGSAPASRAT